MADVHTYAWMNTVLIAANAPRVCTSHQIALHYVSKKCFVIPPVGLAVVFAWMKTTVSVIEASVEATAKLSMMHAKHFSPASKSASAWEATRTSAGAGRATYHPSPITRLLVNVSVELKKIVYTASV